MAQRVEHNPLQDALAALLTQGLDGAGTSEIRRWLIGRELFSETA